MDFELWALVFYIVLPKLFAKKFLGIDLGTSSIRMVELGSSGGGFSLFNYGQIDLDKIETDTPKSFSKGSLSFSTDEIAEMIQTVLVTAKIKTKQCALSIPDFSTFFTAFSLPPMTEKEIPKAVTFEARQHIPLPIESVTLDWQLVSGDKTAQKLEVTVAAVPNEIIEQYHQIAAKAGLEVVLMEAEMFGLARSLVSKDETQSVCLVDIGEQSTVCSLVEKQTLKYSHSFDRGVRYLVEDLTRRLPISQELARRIKDNYGLKLISAVDPQIKEKLKDVLREALEPILREIATMLNDYRNTSNNEAAKIIISGGIGGVAEIEELFKGYFKKEIEIANPFKEINYPLALDPAIKAIGPIYAVAVGMAQRGLEFLKYHKK